MALLTRWKAQHGVHEPNMPFDAQSCAVYTLHTNAYALQAMFAAAAYTK